MEIKTTLKNVLDYYCVTLQDNHNGSVDVITEDGFFGTYNKEYVRRICRETGHSFKRLHKN